MISPRVIYNYNKTMTERDRIDIKSRGMGGVINSKLDQDLMVVTEYEPAHSVVVSRLYRQGEILQEHRVACNIDPGETAKLEEFIRRQDAVAVQVFRAALGTGGMSQAEYISELNAHLRARRTSAAVQMLKEAMAVHPDDPFLLSYYGVMLSMVDRKHSAGIEMCKRAITELKRRVPFGLEYLYPTFYLNLGRAHLAAGKRSEAAAYFNKGLRYEPENPDLIAEISAMGKRRQPPIPFLKRSNPLNKYIGKLTTAPATKGDSEGK